jgi:hypothetical protein
MRTIIIVFIGCAVLVVCSQRAADEHARLAHQECLDKGGFPISKGPRSYEFHCFATDPTIK